MTARSAKTMSGLLWILLLCMLSSQQGHAQNAGKENELCHTVTREYQSVEELKEKLFQDPQIQKVIQASTARGIHLTINIFKNDEKFMMDDSNLVTSPSKTTAANMEHDETGATRTKTDYCAKIMVHGTQNKDNLMKQLQNVWKSLDGVSLTRLVYLTGALGSNGNVREELEFDVTSLSYIPFANLVQHYKNNKPSDESFYGLPFPCDWEKRFFGRHDLAAYKIFDNKTSFTKGKEQCKRFGARLATAVLSGKTMVLQTQLREDKKYWVRIQENYAPCNYTSKEDLHGQRPTQHESTKTEENNDSRNSDKCTGNELELSCECNYGYICELYDSNQ